MAILRRKRNAVSLLLVWVTCLAATQLALADEDDTERLPRIGLLSWTSCKSSDLTRKDGEWSTFLAALKELGYTPGLNVEIDCRSANETVASLDGAAAELARIPDDVIVSASAQGAAAVRRATKSIPHVGIDEGLFGNAFSDSKTNFTGLVNYWIELTGKRLELLKEAVPGLRNVAVLSVPRGLYKSYESRSKRAAKELGLELTFYRISDAATLDDTFSMMKAQGAEAVILVPDATLEAEAGHIASLAKAHKLPTMAWDTKLTQDGILLAYSSDTNEQRKRLAFYVDRILKGSTPQQLPIEQPATLELSVNLVTARLIGLSLPQVTMLRADQVIE